MYNFDERHLGAMKWSKPWLKFLADTGSLQE